jgi:nucleotide-binding universal stress UspA family protein
MAGTGAGEGPVVIAYDGSPAARQAIVDSAKILRSRQVLVVTVWEEGLAYAAPATPVDAGMTLSPPVDPEAALELDRAVHEDAERVAHEGAALARSLGLDAEPIALPDERNVARTLLGLVRERNAVAIVTGSRGLTGIRARLEGSTSKSLLKHASCPVIVVHEANEEHDRVEDDA